MLVRQHNIQIDNHSNENVNNVGIKTMLFVTLLIAVPTALAYISQDHLEEARFYISKNKHDLVQRELGEALRFNYLNNDRILFEYARYHLAQSQKNDRLSNLIKAESSIQQAILMHPTEWQYYSFYAEIARQFGDIQKEKQMLAKAIELNPTRSFREVALMARHLIVDAKVEEALHMLDRYIKMYENYIKMGMFTIDPEKIYIYTELSHMYTLRSQIHTSYGNKLMAERDQKASDHYGDEAVKGAFR